MNPISPMPLYTTLADWWPLLSHPDDYREEAELYWDVISRHARRPVRTILELGSGGGNNASHLKARANLVLTDLSEPMLRVSERLNPTCEHVQGDMRSLRLERTFDAVFVHDAVMSMRTEADLLLAMRTARAHLSPGGVAIFVPDCTRETWREGLDTGGHDADGRALRYVEWTHAAGASTGEFVVDMACMLREADGTVRVEHERHRYGLFDRVTWLRLLAEAGFDPASETPEPSTEVGEIFIGA